MVAGIPFDKDSKIWQDLAIFLDHKHTMSEDLLELLCSKTKDRNKLLELLVENAADDVVMYGKLSHTAYVAMFGELPRTPDADRMLPLDDRKKEVVKYQLFFHLGMTDDVKPSDQ